MPKINFKGISTTALAKLYHETEVPGLKTIAYEELRRRLEIKGRREIRYQKFMERLTGRPFYKLVSY